MQTKNLFAITTLAFALTSLTWGQIPPKSPQARAKARTGQVTETPVDKDSLTVTGRHTATTNNKLGSGTDNANRRQTTAIANPFGLGGTAPLGRQRRNGKAMNLGDTATHEVGHKGNRRQAPNQFRPNPTGDGTTQQARKAKPPSNFSWGESSSGSQQQNNRRRQPRVNMQYNPKELGVDKVRKQNRVNR